jgi:hypothetical protein
MPPRDGSVDGWSGRSAMDDDEHLNRILDEMSRQSRYQKKLFDEAMFNRIDPHLYGMTDEEEGEIIDADWRTIEGVKELEG